MKKLVLLLPLCFLLAVQAFALNTVTGTIVDANGNQYASGTVSATLLTNAGTASTVTNGTLDANGSFSMTLATGTYTFTLCASTVSKGPTSRTTPRRVCFTSAPISVTTTTDISTSVTPSLIGPPSALAATLPNCSVNSNSPAACGSARVGAFVIPASQTSYVVNTAAVTATSRIFITPLTFAADLPSTPTCVVPTAGSAVPTVSASTAGTSFTLTVVSQASTTCWYFLVID